MSVFLLETEPFTIPTIFFSQSKSGIDIPNILFIMSGLNDEIKALRERLNASITENQELREIRDELLATNSEQKDDNSVEIEDAASYRARIAELQVLFDLLTP